MIMHTTISYGYIEFIKVFFKANNLVGEFSEREEPVLRLTQIDIEIEDDSDTALTLTFMGMKHLGVENMLCDYLTRCGIDVSVISIGRASIKRDMNKVEEEWQAYKKTIGV